jgi:hypothetical protein
MRDVSSSKTLAAASSKNWAAPLFTIGNGRGNSSKGAKKETRKKRGERGKIQQ